MTGQRRLATSERRALCANLWPMLVRRALIGAVAFSLVLAAAAWVPVGPGALGGLQGENVGPGTTVADPGHSLWEGFAPDTSVVAEPDTVTTVAPDLGLRPIPIPADSYAPETVVEIGRIQIPAIGLDQSLFDGVTLHNIDRGPSHWPGTAMPGQPGNTVVAGHRITNTHPFRNLDSLVGGDEVIFEVGGTRSVYHVVDSLTVRPDDVWIANQTPAATGTLYACHPPGSQAYRFVIRMVLAA